MNKKSKEVIGLIPELRGKVQTEVIRLDSLQREALIKYFWEGSSIEEIASQMRLRNKSVSKLLDMGLDTIKQRLASAGLGKEFAPA